MSLGPYHAPLCMYIKTEDPDLPAFYYDPLIHPIPFYKTGGASSKVRALAVRVCALARFIVSFCRARLFSSSPA